MSKTPFITTTVETAVKVYTEPRSTQEAMQRRYWRQSNEAQAAGHPNHKNSRVGHKRLRVTRDSARTDALTAAQATPTVNLIGR
jgi:hypothetical protein